MTRKRIGKGRWGASIVPKTFGTYASTNFMIKSGQQKSLDLWIDTNIQLKPDSRINSCFPVLLIKMTHILVRRRMKTERTNEPQWCYKQRGSNPQKFPHVFNDLVLFSLTTRVPIAINISGWPCELSMIRWSKKQARLDGVSRVKLKKF